MIEDTGDTLPTRDTLTHRISKKVREAMDALMKPHERGRTFFITRLAACGHPLGIMSVGQRKKFCSKTCRAKRHNHT